MSAQLPSNGILRVRVSHVLAPPSEGSGTHPLLSHVAHLACLPVPSHMLQIMPHPPRGTAMSSPRTTWRKPTSGIMRTPGPGRIARSPPHSPKSRQPISFGPRILPANQRTQPKQRLHQIHLVRHHILNILIRLRSLRYIHHAQVLALPRHSPAELGMRYPRHRILYLLHLLRRVVFHIESAPSHTPTSAMRTRHQRVALPKPPHDIRRRPHRARNDARRLLAGQGRPLAMHPHILPEMAFQRSVVVMDIDEVVAPLYVRS